MKANRAPVSLAPIQCHTGTRGLQCGWAGLQHSPNSAGLDSARSKSKPMDTVSQPYHSWVHSCGQGLHLRSVSLSDQARLSPTALRLLQNVEPGWAGQGMKEQANFHQCTPTQEWAWRQGTSQPAGSQPNSPWMSRSTVLAWWRWCSSTRSYPQAEVASQQVRLGSERAPSRSLTTAQLVGKPPKAGRSGQPRGG